MRIGDIDAGEDMVHRPEVMYRFAAVGHDNEGSFSAQVVDQQLEECVDGEGLVDVSDWVDKGCRSS